MDIGVNDSCYRLFINEERISTARFVMKASRIDQPAKLPFFLSKKMVNLRNFLAIDEMPEQVFLQRHMCANLEPYVCSMNTVG